MKKSGVTIPPLPPDSSVTAVATIFHRKARIAIDAGGRERALDRRDAEPRVLVADDTIEDGEEDAPRGRDEVRMMLESAQAVLDPTHRLDQEERDEAEHRPENDREADELGVSEGADTAEEGRHRGLHPADEMSDDPGDEAREENRVLDPSEVEHLDPEERPGDRRAEHGRESAADPADHEAAAVLVVQPQDVGEKAGDRRADLGAGPFLADRAAEHERHDGREELDRARPSTESVPDPDGSPR